MRDRCGRSGSRIGSVHADLVLLDVMLPRSSGFDLVPIIRRERRSPSCSCRRGLPVDKLRGLRPRPTTITEAVRHAGTLARIRAVLRRTAGVVDRISSGRSRSISPPYGPGPTGLLRSRIEEFILQFLAERSNRTVHRDQLIHQVWSHRER